MNFIIGRPTDALVAAWTIKTDYATYVTHTHTHTHTKQKTLIITS